MKKLVLGLLAGVIFLSANAQRSEFGLFLGTSFYMGELNPETPYAFTKPAGGLVYRYNFTPRWALKLNAYDGWLEGQDKRYGDKDRNLSFKSNIFEVGANIELNFWPYVTGSKTDNLTPFIFAGVCIFHFNPTAEYNGVSYELQPLGTEGQGTTLYPDRSPYTLTAVGVPFGLGLKVSLGQDICLAAEFGMRKTFTDYIDDVSTTYVDSTALTAQKSAIAYQLSNRTEHPVADGFQRGDVSTKDWYSFSGITITFKLKTKKRNLCPAYKDHLRYREFYMNQSRLR